MYKVLRSYSKKAERKHELTRSSDQHHAANGVGGAHNAFALTATEEARNGQVVPMDSRRIETMNSAWTGAQAFSESSSYEAREHFERKVQRVKKTRGERDSNRKSKKSKVSEVLSSVDGVSARDALLQWAQDVTRGYPGVNVRNFTSSWRDGLAFNAILHRYRPNLIQWNKISDESVSARERLDNAFAAAESEFGVSRLLDAEDVDVETPDEKSIITYVSSLYNALPHTSELNKYEEEMYQYEREASEWLQWVQRATHLMDDRQMPSNIGELRRLQLELERFKSEDLPPKAKEKQRLADLYAELYTLFEGTEHMKIPADLSTQGLDRAWQRLLVALSERFSVLDERAGLQGSMADIISRLTRGIGITNEKLDHILQRIEDAESRIDSSRPADLQRIIDAIIDDLVALESPILGFFEDVDQLKQNRHPEANDFYQQVYGLEQRRQSYMTRLRTQFMTRLGVRSETLIRESEQRRESVRRSTFGRVDECIQWVRVRLEKLSEMEFVEDLEHLESMFEEHKLDNHDIQDFRQNVDECIARQYEEEMYQYEREASEWLQWVQRATHLMDDRQMPSNIGELRRLQLELERFKSEDLPPKAKEKQRLADLYAELYTLFEGTEHMKIPADLSTQGLDRAWQRLLVALSERFSVLDERAGLQGSMADIISRLTRGIGITNEKLDHILQRIEDAESRIDSSRPADLQRIIDAIIDDLVALESPILGFFEDVDQLKQNRHPEANDFYQQVYGLEQRRQSYMTRLRTQFMTRLGVRSETLIRESEQRRESVRRSTFGRVDECIQWVRVRLEKLSEMEFVEDLEHLESMFEEHKLDNHDIQDFRQNVDECIARQAEVSTEDTHEYCELLSTLESEYQQLRDLSAGRMLDLDTLIAFVRGAQQEIVWINEREDIEVTRNWSDVNQLDLPMLQNYYKQLLHEIELREPRFNDVHNKGAALLNQGHPAVHVIEFYLSAMQRKWDWLLALSKCLEQHLRDALNLKSFMEDAAAAEDWMVRQTELLERKYNRSDFSLEEGEQLLRELDEINELIKKYHSVLMTLTERSSQISPLWQRGERIHRPIPVTALADYVDRSITIREGDECMLVDNSDLIHWVVRGPDGVEASVPSVVFRIPPPDARLTAYLNRLHTNFDKLRRIWEKKHRMVRFDMVLNTMAQIRGWDLDTFMSIDPDQRDAIIKALNDDAHKLLAELDPNDPLALRLKEELRLTNEHFYNLLNQSMRPKEPDIGSQFDAKIAELLKKLEEAFRKLNDHVAQGVPRSPEELERLILEHKDFEEALQALDVDVSTVKELFRQIPNPTPSQRANHDHLNGRWEDLWELSRMYVERLKAVEGVLHGIGEVSDIVRQHEITLNSFDDMPAALDKLRGVHSQLLEMNMVLQQQQSVVDSLNRNIALLRQHISRTRQTSSHPDVDRLEDEVQMLTVRWENVCSQVAERLKSAERALQTQMIYRSEYDNEISWLDRVEATINSLRRPEDMRPEQYQAQLDLLIAEYAQLQERTEAIENLNREGGKFIREAKGYDSRLVQYLDTVLNIHGPTIRNDFRRTEPQPKNGAQQVAEELERLNRRFAQLSSLILERRNVMQVLIQNWKRQKQEEEDRRRAEEEEKRRQFEAARLKALEDADRLRQERRAAEEARRAAEEAERLRRAREAAEEARRRAEEEARRRAEEEARRAEEEARRRKQAEDDERERERLRREEEGRRRWEEEERRRRQAMEDAERERERQRREDEERRRREEERRRREDEERRRRQAEEDADRERRRKDEEEARRRAEEEARRRAEEEARRRKQAEEEERRRREEEERRRRKIPDVRHGLQQTIAPEGMVLEEFEEIRDSPARATIAEHEDEMQMYQEETVTKTQFYEMEGILHKQTGEILTFVEAVRQGLLDLHSSGGEFFDIVSGARISLEKAAELGYIDGSFHEVLNRHHGIRHPVTHESLTLLEAIQIGLYDPDIRQLRDINTGEILPMYDCIVRGIITLDTQHRLIKMGILKLPPMTLENAIEQGVVNRETGQFTGKYTRETMPLKDALYNGYIQIGSARPIPMIAITLTDCIQMGLINTETGEFIDKNSGEKLTLRDAVSKQNSLLNLHIPEIIRTDESRRVTLGDAIVRNAINTRQGNYTDLQKSQSMSLWEAYNQDLIQKPLTLTEIHAKDLIDSTNKFIDGGTKHRYTLLEAIAAGLIDAEVRHIVDPELKDVISIAEALERGLLEPDGKIVVPSQQKIYSFTEAVSDGLLIKRVRHTIFDVKGIKNTKTKESLTFNEAVEAGAVIVQAERIVDLATQESFLLADCADRELIDPMLHELFSSPIGIKDASGQEMTVFRAVAKGFIDPTKGVYLDKRANRELSPKEAYDAGYITLRGAIQLSALFDIHPSLMSPVKKVDHKKRIRRPGQRKDLAADQVKVTLAEAMKQGLIDSKTHRFRQGETEMSFEDALNQGLIDPSDEWIVPSKTTGVGPTIEEKTSETIMETGQQLAPKFYPDKNIEESVTTIKKVKTTETTAVGGPGGVSVYRAITGGKGTIEVPADGYHIHEAERKGYISLSAGVVSPPNVDRTLTLEEAFDLGVINSKNITVREPNTGRLISVAEAMEKKIMDKNGFVTSRGRRVNLQTAIEEKVVVVEAEPPATTASSAKKVIQFSAGTGAVISFRPVGTATIEESEQSWSFDATRGELIDHIGGGRLPLDAALAAGKILPEDLRVRDALTGREMSFEEAEKWGIIDQKDHYFFDKRDNKRYTLAEAAQQHRIYPTGGVPENASDAIHTTVKVQKRTEVSKKEALASGPSAFVDQTLASALESGWYSSQSGTFTHPDTNKQMTLKEAIIRGLFNPYGTTVIDRRNKRELSLLEAIQDGLVNDSAGTVLDTETGRNVDLVAALRDGLLKSGNLPESLEGALMKGKLDFATGQFTAQDGRNVPIHEAISKKMIDSKTVVVRDPGTGEEMALSAAVDKKIVDLEKGVIHSTETSESMTFPQALTSGVLAGAGSRSTHVTQRSPHPRLIEQKLQLTPYSQPIEPKTAVALREQRTMGAGRQEMVDLGGGKQVMVKVVRGEGGVEKGEYVDPSSGMKFTIQLHGDPYVTETKTMVKSTAQVQSVELEPHAEFVGIDKIRDKRNGRIMSLQDAQRIGIARVDRKGKQMTKTYSVFRSNIQNALAKGVLDSHGEKISLEDAIRAKLIDIRSLTYVSPKTGEALPLPQAANMGLLDVTLSEILPKGVCHPASGEKISIERAIELDIINPKTGEVKNPFTKEKLSWLDIMKPVYASLTMEGVYDPTKGYGVPVISALIEGLIDTKTAQYSNIITGEKIPLTEASSKGLIDEETFKAITEPFLVDFRTKRKLNLIEAVQAKLIDPRNRTIQLDEHVIIPVARATADGKIPRFIGERLKRVDKLTFAESLGKGLIDVAQNRFTDPDSGRQMSINQAIEEGYIDTGKVEAMEGSDERNLANILYSEEFDENSGRIRDKKSGLYLTFRAAVERDVIDGDSLFHDIDSSQTMTLREALNRGRIDSDGKYIETKNGAKLNLKQAVANGLIALIASPMQAAQAVTEAVKRRDAEGYKFKIESVDDRRSSTSGPRFREESSVIRLSSPHRVEPGLSVRVRSSSEAMSGGDRARSLIDDPQALADLQHEFLDNLAKQRFDIEEQIIENPATSRRVSVREAAESGLLDVVTGEIVHPSSGRRYSIPRAVHMKMVNSDAAKRLMESLNMSLEELGQQSSSYTTESLSGMSPTESGGTKIWTKTVSWHGQPSELRHSASDPLAPYTSYTSTTTTSRTSDVPLWARYD
ncbi:Plectin [Toxocara canis]|uniref:Plectin n=1 Tax=Toxocara canis TaxID=6265 RepID=A0A0B2V519_TOXCA|nr:Plectin [Toxocara canis]